MEHDAKRAGKHFDLRFKMPDSNNWASFAVRKGVPIQSGQKVLAVRTHDHSRKDALMTGEIKSGYGAGKLKKWDSGKCEILKYKTSSMSIIFKGSKVKGLYHLVSTGVIDKKFDGKQYLLFKGKD
jgi:bifunctional non-homologous end joining protein LigD